MLDNPSLILVLGFALSLMVAFAPGTLLFKAFPSD